jgi:hypothetical protein
MPAFLAQLLYSLSNFKLLVQYMLVYKNSSEYYFKINITGRNVFPIFTFRYNLPL